MDVAMCVYVCTQLCSYVLQISDNSLEQQIYIVIIGELFKGDTYYQACQENSWGYKFGAPCI